MQIKVKLLSANATAPMYGYVGDAGLDLFSAVDMTVSPKTQRTVSTNIAIEIPSGYVGLVWDKSGLSEKGITILAGVIDSSYRGEIKVIMANLSKKPYKVLAKKKIAQLLIQPVITAEVKIVSELMVSRRGEKGFGSTGLE